MIYGKMRNQKLHMIRGLHIKMFKIEFFSYYETVFVRYPRVGVKRPHLGGISNTTGFLDPIFGIYMKN